MSELTERMKRNAEQLDAIADVMRDSEATAIRVEAVATMLKSMRCLNAAADEIDRLTAALAEAREAREHEHAQFLEMGSMYITAKVEAAEAREEAVGALEAWQAWEARLILEGSDALWCELGDLNELQAIRNDAIAALKEKP